MKKLARLILFFSLSFAILLLAGTGLRFIALRVQWMRYLPAGNEEPLTALITAARWALSLTLYGSVLLSLSYIARRKIFYPAALVCVIVLSLGLGYGVSLGLERLSLIPPGRTSVPPPGEAGVIISQGSTSVILLKGPQSPRGPQLIAAADRPLVYRPEQAAQTAALPPLPLGSDSPWFLKSIAIDLRLNSEQLLSHLAIGVLPFFTYTGALVFFLASLGFLLKLSAWPLANLFMGSLVFRLILSLETLINSPEVRDVFASVTGNRLTPLFVVPLIFCALGTMVYIYSVLVYLAKRRQSEEDYQ